MLLTVLAFDIQAKSDEPSDTARIRMILNELSYFPYINQQKDYYLQLEQLAKKTGDIPLLAKCCYKLSTIYLQQSDYPRTIHYAQRALRYYEALKDDNGRAKCNRVMGTLYMLLSPAQADLYHDKSLELASSEDSIQAVISKCMMFIFIQPGINNEKVFDEIRRIDLNRCSPLQKEAMNYFYSVMAQQNGDMDCALTYIQKVDSFFSYIPQEGYMNCMIQRQLALVHFDRGDLRSAKQALARSDSICKRDSIRLTAIANLKVWSDIFQAEGYELESLLTFKNYSNKLDSILGLSQMRSLNSMLMQILLHENEQKQNPQRFHGYILTVFLMIGIFILYYFRDSFIKRREKYQLLSQLSEQTCQIGLSPELRHHFSIVMIEYKKGLGHYMRLIRNSGGKPEDFQHLNHQMDETNAFIDRFKKWLDHQPYHPNQPTYFDARKITEVIVRMLKIIFHSKQITIYHHIENDIFVYGNMAYFCIAFEILLFRLMQDCEQNGVITLSAHDGDEFATFTIVSPNYVISDKIRVMIQLLTQKLQTNPKTAISLQTRAEICLKCIYDNGGTSWFESCAEKGTMVNFTMPKKEISG